MNEFNEFFDFWLNRYGYLRTVESFVYRKADLLDFIDEFHKLLEFNLNPEITNDFPIKTEHLEFILFIQSLSKILYESLNEILSEDSIGYQETEDLLRLRIKKDFIPDFKKYCKIL